MEYDIDFLNNFSNIYKACWSKMSSEMYNARKL